VTTISRTACLLSILAFVGCALSAQPDQSVTGVRGSWVRKRLYLSQAQAANEQLQKDALAAQKSRSQFSAEFERVDKKVDEFYSIKGFARGKLGGLLDEIKADLERDKQRRLAAALKRSKNEDTPINFYDVQSEAIEQDVKRLTREFDQLNLDMKSIADLDNSLKDRLKAADKQIKEASEAASQSTKKLEQLWWIIDDQKAAESFYAMQGLADKVSSIKKYLEDTLLADFKSVAQTVEKQIEQVNKQIEAIEQRGLILTHRTTRMSKNEKSALIDAPVRANESSEEDAPVRPRRKRERATSWTDYCLALPGRIFTQIVEWLTVPIEYFSGFWSAPKKTIAKGRRAPRVQEEDDSSVVDEPEATQ